LRSELNELEQQNIAEADSWAFSRKRDVLSDALLKSLHRRMFNRVWRWAGEFRTTGKNVGVDALRIETELHQIVEDTKYWVDHQSLSWRCVFTIVWCSRIRSRTVTAAGRALRRTC
jgi:fido (protein-threonine AMPylation protein)